MTYYLSADHVPKRTSKRKRGEVTVGAVPEEPSGNDADSNNAWDNDGDSETDDDDAFDDDRDGAVDDGDDNHESTMTCDTDGDNKWPDETPPIAVKRRASTSQK